MPLGLGGVGAGVRFHNRKVSGSIPTGASLIPEMSVIDFVGSMQPPVLLSRMYGKPYVRVK